MIKRAIALILTLCVAVSVLAGCGGGDGGAAVQAPAPAPQGTAAQGSGAAVADAADVGTMFHMWSSNPEPGSTVRILAPQFIGGKDDEEQRLFEIAMREMTGLNIEFERPLDFSTALIQRLQAGEQFDLVYLHIDQYKEFILQEALTDITDWMANSSIFQNNVEPSEIAGITVDGRVYGSLANVQTHRLVAANRNMLEAAGIDYRTIEPTFDGYLEVFRALRAANPDPDFFPLNAVIWQTWDLQPWFAGIGLKNGPIRGDDGLIFASYARDEAAPVWEWFRQLYQEGLLDPGSFVDTSGDMRSKMSAGSQRTAITVDWAMWIGLHNANARAAGIGPDEFEIVPLPGIRTPDGGHMLVKGNPAIWGVPANAPNPEGAKAFLEFVATQEGGQLFSVGVEGHDYNIVNGEWVLTEIGIAHASDHGAPVPLYKNFWHPVGFNPGVAEAMRYLHYATTDLAIPVNDTEFRQTQGRWYVEIIRGNVEPLEGLRLLREELVSLGFTDR